MGQHDLSIANAAAAAVRTDLNNALAALATLNAGPAAPAPTRPGLAWFDTSTRELKMRNAADTAWIVLAGLASADAVRIHGLRARGRRLDIVNAAGTRRLRFSDPATSGPRRKRVELLGGGKFLTPGGALVGTARDAKKFRTARRLGDRGAASPLFDGSGPADIAPADLADCAGLQGEGDDQRTDKIATVSQFARFVPGALLWEGGLVARYYGPRQLGRVCVPGTVFWLPWMDVRISGGPAAGLEHRHRRVRMQVRTKLGDPPGDYIAWQTPDRGVIPGLPSGLQNLIREEGFSAFLKYSEDAYLAVLPDIKINPTIGGVPNWAWVEYGFQVFQTGLTLPVRPPADPYRIRFCVGCI